MMSRAFACAALVLTLAGCTATAPDEPAKTPAIAATTEVVLRDITSVVVVSGDVASNPHYLATAPVAGVLTYVATTKTLAPGTNIADVAGTKIATPALGQVVQWLRSSGETVAKNSPVAELAYSGFGIPVEVPAELLYRIYGPMPVVAKANITGGPSGVACTLVPTSTGGDVVAVPDDGYRPSLCLLPLDVDVTAALPAKVGVPTASHPGVLALPVSAVSGFAGSGQVSLVDGSLTSTVDVELGISDGAYVEIVGGLSKGDLVLARAPGIQ